jgi:hypothetical protein
LQTGGGGGVLLPNTSPQTVRVICCTVLHGPAKTAVPVSITAAIIITFAVLFIFFPFRLENSVFSSSPGGCFPTL